MSTSQILSEGPVDEAAPATDYSRTLRLAAGTAAHDESDLEARLQGCSVLITADPPAPAALTTLRVLVGNLRRLPVQLHLEPAGGDEALDPQWVAALEELASSIDANRKLIVARPAQITVHVHVGASGTGALVSGVADGHGARLRPRGHAFPALVAPGTGLGGVLTGAMLTAEAFKVLVDVLPHRRGSLRPVDFCPVSLSSPAGPALAPSPIRETALIGAGAIGTAIALILRELGAQGTLTVIDPEVFEAPNVTTYSLGGPADATHQISKVDLIHRELRGMDIMRLQGTARDYITAIENSEFPMPCIVLGALDSIEARHDIAAIHALHTLDGSTGGPAGTTLSLSEATWTGPCMRCYYPRQHRSSGPTADQLLAERTGLSLERIARGQDRLTADELDALSGLTPEDRAILETQVGKAMCGLGKSLGLVGSDDGFNPSAAFVAQQAAVLVVGALIRGGTGHPAKSVQYDALFGPNRDMTLPRNPQPGCRCQTGRDLHDQIRAHRHSATARLVEPDTPIG